MTARIVSVKGKRVTLQVEFELGASMLEMESGIQDAVNAVGMVATGEFSEEVVSVEYVGVVTVDDAGDF